MCFVAAPYGLGDKGVAVRAYAFVFLFGRSGRLVADAKKRPAREELAKSPLVGPSGAFDGMHKKGPIEGRKR